MVSAWAAAASKLLAIVSVAIVFMVVSASTESGLPTRSGTPRTVTIHKLRPNDYPDNL